MPNMSNTKTPMKLQDPMIRNSNFEEVSCGYTEEEAMLEANRCLNCPRKPCISGCPVKIHIPDFIKEVANGNFEKAYEIISNSSTLPAVCGRVCPQETQCESKCVRGVKGEAVAIGRLERFVADYHNTHNTTTPLNVTPNGHKVAIIGSGPSGLTCAGDLAKLGYDVTIYEALHIAGGVLVYGIPEFRLPKTIVETEINKLKDMGVHIVTNFVVGKTLSIDELMQEYNYDAVFIGTGAGLPRFMNIEGENLNGVYSANEYLTRINLMKAYKTDSDTPIKKSNTVAVVGGGNVAMDAARCAKRLGAKNVYIIYRRSMEEIPARREEVEHAIEEGIIFKLLTNPIRILGDENKNVSKIECVEMTLSEPDESNRRRPIVKPNSEHMIDVDTVIMAIGTSPNPLIKNTTANLETESFGGIKILDESGRTSKDGVYAGGDSVTGSATVILAMGAGKNSAIAIDEYIKEKYKNK